MLLQFATLITVLRASFAAEPHKGMADLPPLLEFSDGTPVRTPSDWQHRRNEISDLLTQYYYG